MFWIDIVLIGLGVLLIYAAGGLIGLFVKSSRLQKILISMSMIVLAFCGAVIIAHIGELNITSIKVGQEYQVIGMSKNINNKNYLMLMRENKVILYETTYDKLPLGQPTSEGVLTAGDMISVLDNGRLIIVEDYPPGCDPGGCG
jgi:hypothetical protein